MNPKVKQFLEEAKAKERAEFEKQRDAHLIKLGLVDEDKSTIEYSDCYLPVDGFEKYDREQNKYYKRVPAPIEVTDEEYELIKRYSATKPTVAQNNDAEIFLDKVNSIVASVSIVISIVLAVLALKDGSWVLFWGAVVIAIVSLISSAAVKVLLNISNNLHEINSKLDK